MLNWPQYGRQKHVLTTYGDEETFLTPWDIFDETDARKAVGDARQCITIAGKVYKHQFGESPPHWEKEQ